MSDEETIRMALIEAAPAREALTRLIAAKEQAEKEIDEAHLELDRLSAPRDTEYEEPLKLIGRLQHFRSLTARLRSMCEAMGLFVSARLVNEKGEHAGWRISGKGSVNEAYERARSREEGGEDMMLRRFLSALRYHLWSKDWRTVATCEFTTSWTDCGTKDTHVVYFKEDSRGNRKTSVRSTDDFLGSHKSHGGVLKARTNWEVRRSLPSWAKLVDHPPTKPSTLRVISGGKK